MNYLQLINRARQECGVSGPDLATVVGQVGEMRRFVNWVQQAWTEIQTAQDCGWLFLNQPFDFVLVPGQQTYPIDQLPVSAAAPDFRAWDHNKFRIYTDTVNFGDEMILPFMDWPTFRNTYQYGQMQTETQKPSCVSEDPYKSLLFGGVPDQAYHVRGRYWRQPQVLTLDTDVPLAPTYYHMLIVYRTMMYYAMFEAASEVLAAGEKWYTQMMRQMEVDQMPPVTFGYPLA